MTGAELLAARERAGMSQTAFGRALARTLGRETDIPQETISRWENDVRPVPDWLPLALAALERRAA